MLSRAAYLRLLARKLRTFPAVLVLGPRQCGKSTLAREFLRATRRPARVTLFDLERPSDQARLRTAPEEDLGLLQQQPGVVCLDEIQRAPELFPLLRVLLDDPRRRARYLLLGSASPQLAGASETLAGRVGILDLTPLLAAEADAEHGAKRARHWTRGGFPRSLLARSERSSFEWREAHVRMFLERDIPALGLRLPALTLRRFWTMLAHLHGGLWNATELAAGLGLSVPTVGRYLDLLEGTFMVRRLAPYWANVGKRLTKAPKIYLRDTGLLHTLLGIPDHEALRSHPKAGPSWEGWVVEQVLGALTLADENVRPYFWRTHGGAEVDLLLDWRGRIVPIEIKLGSDPQATRGLTELMKDLHADAGFVLHGGDRSYPLGAGRWAMSVGLVGDPAALREALLRPARTLAR